MLQTSGTDSARAEDASENLGKNIFRRGRGIDSPHDRARIAFENAEGFGLEDGQSSPQNTRGNIVGSIVLQRAPPEALFEHGLVFAAQVHDKRYVDEGFHQARLVPIAGNAIQNNPLAIGLEGGRPDMIFKTFLPQSVAKT